MNDNKPGISRVAFGFVFTTALMDSIGWGLMIPVLPDLLMEVTETSLSDAAIYSGWMMFAYAAMQFLFAPVLGNLSDAYGRKPILMVSILVLAANYVIIGLAETFAVIVIARLMTGICSATHSTCSAYIADVTTIEERPQYFGIMSAAFGAGFVIGPVLGGLLGEYGTRVPFFAAATLLVLNLCVGLVAFPESLQPTDRRKFELLRANPLATFNSLSKFKVVYGMMGVYLLYHLGHNVLPAVWNFFTIEQFDWSPREVGYSLAFIGVLMFITQAFLVRWIVERLEVRRAAILGFVLMVATFFGYATASQGWMLYVAMVPGALAGIVGPTMATITSSQVGSSQQGELQGGLSSLMSLASIVSPPIMTLTFGLFTGKDAIVYFPGAPFMLSVFLTLLAFVLFLRTTQDFVIDASPETR